MFKCAQTQLGFHCNLHSCVLVVVVAMVVACIYSMYVSNCMHVQILLCMHLTVTCINQLQSIRRDIYICI